MPGVPAVFWRARPLLLAVPSLRHLLVAEVTPLRGEMEIPRSLRERRPWFLAARRFNIVIRARDLLKKKNSLLFAA